MNLGGRIAVALKKLNWRPADLARMSGVAATTVRIMIERDSKTSQFLEQMLAVLPKDQINVDWVRTGQGKPEVTAHREGNGTLPRAAGKEGVQVGAGEGQPMGEYGLAAPLRSWEHPTELPTGEWVLIPRLGVLAPPPGSNEVKVVKLHEEVQIFKAGWIRDDQLKPSALTWHDAIDASMERVIWRGDVFVIDTSQTGLVDGAVFGIWYSGALRPRRVSLLPSGGVRLRPENPDFDTMDIAPADVPSLRVVGRVVRREGKGGL